jgi:regulator of RNase E activity RraA
LEHPTDRTFHSDRFPWVTRRQLPARIARSVIERFEQMTDLSSTVSDVLDEMGIVGAVGSSRLRPSLPGGRVIGTAITVRNVEQRRSAFAAVTDREWRMAEILAVADAAPGDVLLIQGVHATSNMGGLLSTVAKREGVIGAVVDGGVRDLGHSRELGLPIWSADVSPITGKWRCMTEEINGNVNVAGLTASAGDLVVADDTGVCIIPRDRVEAVLARCEVITKHEAEAEAAIEAGVPLPELIEHLYGPK